jgi:hypothetical protein
MKTRRSFCKNNKSRRQKRIKRGGAARHFEDENLSSAYNYISDYSENTSYWLNKYLEHKGSDDYEKIKEINDMLIEGREMMTTGYAKFEKLMSSE